MIITDPVAKIKAAVEKEFADEFRLGLLYNLGVYNRRYIAGTTTWSQHAWGNAWDIGVKDNDKVLGDRVKAFLVREDNAGRLKVRLILWQVKNHYNHLHVEGDPKKYGTPPLPDTGSEEEEVKEVVAGIQKGLKDAGFDPGPIDGLWGPKTQAGFTAAMKAAAKSGDTYSNADAVAAVAAALLD